MNKLKIFAERRDRILKKYPDLPKEAAAVRKKAISGLPDLLSQCRKALKDKGCQVYLADSKEDARKMITDLLSGHGKVVRTYSSALREISFDTFLGDAGIQVSKSHIGEIVAERVDMPAAPALGDHPFLPWIDLPRKEIIQALRRYLTADEALSSEELNRAAHRKIKQEILQSDFGVTGVNGVAAENGTLVIAEDEGNCRAVSNLPFRHLAVAGIDKLSYSVEGSLKILECQSVFGLGRRTPTYTSLISGPSRTGDIEFRITFGMHGPKEVHVVLLDNGRTSLVEQGFGELLECIDCGACYESIAPAAEANGWKGVSLTPKGIALGMVQGILSNPETEPAILSFSCPVNIDGPRLGKILPQIRSLVSRKT
ncbi:MAG: lactate utilization protein [Candidatus Aminicenantes bacterium]|nr:lactate utilization protein [Candidatus Aminicenantes bacterium]